MPIEQRSNSTSRSSFDPTDETINNAVSTIENRDLESIIDSNTNKEELDTAIAGAGGGSDSRVDWMLDTTVFTAPIIAYQPISAEINSTGEMHPITVSGSEPFESYAITSGTLPNGFTFNTTNGYFNWSTDGNVVSPIQVGVTATNPVGDSTEYIVNISVEAPQGITQYTNDLNLYVGVRVSTSKSTRAQVLLKQPFFGKPTSTSNGTMIEDLSSPIWVGDNGDGTWNYLIQPEGYTYWLFYLNSTTDPSNLANGYVSDLTTSLGYDLVTPSSQDVTHDGVNYPSDATDVHYFAGRYYLALDEDASLDGFQADAGGSWSFGFKLTRAWKKDGLGRPMFAREGRNWQGVIIGHSATYSQMTFGNGSSQTYDSSEVGTIPTDGFAVGSYVRCTYDDSSNVFSFYVNGTKYYDYSISSYLDDSPTADSLRVLFGKSVDSDDLSNTNDSYEVTYWQGAIQRMWIANGTVISTDDDGTTYPTGTTHAWGCSEVTGKVFSPSIGSVTMRGERTTF